GAWIGGDRDGNPFVTNEVTRRTVYDNRVASLRRYRQRLGELLRALSATERAARISLEFREALARQVDQSGAGEHIAARNPGEVFRQYVACMLRRLDATLTCAEHGTTAPSPDAAGYRAADELIADLQTLESGLADARAAHAAARLVRPVRREVEAFRFSTFLLSMTHDAADVLGACLLAKEAGLFADAAGTESCTLPIVPLFESVDDLRRAPEIVHDLLQVPLIRRSVRAQGGVYEVMIGYS